MILSSPEGRRLWRTRLSFASILLLISGSSLIAQDFNLGLRIPQPGFIRPFPLETQTLPNGLRVVYLEDHEVPLVQGVFAIRTGSAFDPPDAAGMTEMLFRTMAESGVRGAELREFRQHLAEMGATLSVDIQPTVSSFNFTVPSENLNALLDLFRRVVIQPSLPVDAMDAARGAIDEAVGQRNNSPEAITARVARQFLFGPDEVFGRIPEYQSVDNITREQLLAHHDKYFYPANCLFALRGDFSASDLRAHPELMFGSWPAGAATAATPPRPADPPKSTVYLSPLRLPDRSIFVILQRGGRFMDRDYAAMLVASTLFVESALAPDLRRRGWDLRLTANWSPSFDEDGTLNFSGSVRSGSTAAALKFIVGQMSQAASMQFSDADIENTRIRVLRTIDASAAGASSRFRQTVLGIFLGMPPDFLAQIGKNVAAVTKADITAALRDHIQPDRVVVSVGGDPNAFVDPLSSLNLPVQQVDLTIPPPKAIEARTDPESLARGRQLLARMRDALGGAEKLAAIHDYQSVAKGTIATAAGGSEIQVTESFIAPGTYRQDQSVGERTITFFYNGTIGWVGTNRVLTTMPRYVVEQMRNQLFRMLFRIAMSDADPTCVISYMGSGIILVQTADGESVRIYVDEGTNLPMRFSYRNHEDTNTYMPVEDRFEDWREVNGVRFPYKITTDRGGRRRSVLDIQEIRVNSGLKLEEVEKKP